MDIVNILLGIVFCFTGIGLAKKPQLLAGYRDLPNNNSLRINIVNRVKRVLLIIGISTIVGSIILSFFNLETMKIWVTILVSAIVPIALVMVTNSPGSNRKVSKQTILVIVFTIIFLIAIGVLFLIAMKNPVIEIDNNNNLSISGLYSIAIPVEDITAIELQHHIPPITLRTNGLAVGEIRKGNFKTKDEGIVKLYLQSIHSPFIKLQTVHSQTIYINQKKADLTQSLYVKLVTSISK